MSGRGSERTHMPLVGAGSVFQCPAIVSCGFKVATVRQRCRDLLGIKFNACPCGLTACTYGSHFHGVSSACGQACQGLACRAYSLRRTAVQTYLIAARSAVPTYICRGLGDVTCNKVCRYNTITYVYIVDYRSGLFSIAGIIFPYEYQLL